MIGDLIAGQDSYEHLNREIKNTMRRSASDAVRLGYLLRKMYDGQLWMARYDCLDEYLQRELHMDYSMATRFVNINKKYSVGGNSEEIADDWTGFSQSVLIEMLNMPPELAVMVTPDMSVRQVQEVKRQARREKRKGKAETEMVAAAGGEASPACSILTEAPAQESDPLPESEYGGNGAEAFPAKNEVPDAEYRELEPVDGVATSQFPEPQPRVSLVADTKARQYLNDFAVFFVSRNYGWFRSNPHSRAINLGLIPGEIKLFLKPDLRCWHFKSGDRVGYINLFDDYVQPWDENGVCLGDYDWSCLASAIRRAYLDVKYEKDAKEAQDIQELPEEVATSQPEEPILEPKEDQEGDAVLHEDAAEDVSGAEPDGSGPEADPERGAATQMAAGSACEAKPDSDIVDRLAEVRQILENERKTLSDYLEVAAKENFPQKLMFKQQTMVAALAEMVRSMEEAEAAEPAPEPREQPPLPLLKNNDQRREWLKSYKDWGLWYRDDNIGVDYYKYDFENGARLVVEVYQEVATRYYEAHESSFLHLIGGPDPMKGLYGICKWQRHEKYSRYPNSETEMIEFLKELQRKGGTT